MSNSVARLPNGSSIAIFAGVTRAVESGFVAAGVTIAVIAALQSLVILVSWVAAL